MMPGNAAAPPAPEEGDEKAMLAQILAELKALNSKLAGTEEVAKEGSPAVIVENEDKKSKPLGGETAGKPQSSLRATVETDPVVNKEFEGMKKELAEMKKEMASVKAVRAPVDEFGGNESMKEIRKEAISDVLNGKHKGRLDTYGIAALKKGVSQ